MNQKRNKIKRRSITCSHICYISISKHAYWLDIHSLKVWWRYVLPNTNVVHFGLLFSNPMFLLFLQLLEKKVLDPNGPYVSTFQTILGNVCLSVISEFCLSSSSVVVYSASTAYNGLYRYLKYLLKVRYITSNHRNVARFFEFWDSLFGQCKNIGLCLKNTLKNLTAFEFGNIHSFTKLSHNNVSN